MTGSTLRELARAYAKGELGREDYRRSRSDLVASILAGDTVVKNIDFPPPLKPPGGDGMEATEPRSRRRSAETSMQQTRPAPVPSPAPAAPPADAAGTVSGPSGAIWMIAGAAVLAVIAGAGYFLNSKRSAQPEAPPAASEPEPTAAAEDPLADAGRSLISQFLQDRNWSEPRMASFQSDWSALDPVRQAAALKSADGGRLASAIYQRLLEERALSGLGDAEASLAKQRALVGFAAAIGISDPRLSVPEAAAAVDAAPPSADVGATD